MQSTEKAKAADMSSEASPSIPQSSDPVNQKPYTVRMSRCIMVLHSMRGVTFGLLAGIFLAFSAYWIDVVQREGAMPSFQIVFLMDIGMFIGVIPFITYKRLKITGDSYTERGVLSIVAVLYFGGFSAFCYALLLGPMANVTGISRGGMPVITPLLALMILRETLHIVDGIVIAINIAGILLLAQPVGIFGAEGRTNDVTSSELVSYLLSIFSAFQWSLAYVSARYLGERTHVLIVLLYVGVIGSILSIILTLTVEHPIWSMSTRMALHTIGLVITNTLGDACRFRALQLEEATTIVLLANIQLFVAFFLQTFVLNEIPNQFSIAGASLVFLGSALCALASWWRDYQREKGENKALLNSVNPPFYFSLAPKPIPVIHTVKVPVNVKTNDELGESRNKDTLE
ncbi:solute carrier family 35 member G1-like [Saccoglossus kowalevskii]|uniref:Solute carrier family 35 member G1-like n=1 Tax=Saccoglossus kowalevskii TaxID=10224 RepID=A0ABM0MB13_SACKO|nr:PREDICTED: solute carrier family 35 member G1-like [Saccoglossus kowalevskii]